MSPKRRRSGSFEMADSPKRTRTEEFTQGTTQSDTGFPNLQRAQTHPLPARPGPATGWRPMSPSNGASSSHAHGAVRRQPGPMSATGGAVGYTVGISTFEGIRDALRLTIVQAPPNSLQSARSAQSPAAGGFASPLQPRPHRRESSIGHMPLGLVPGTFSSAQPAARGPYERRLQQARGTYHGMTEQAFVRSQMEQPPHMSQRFPMAPLHLPPPALPYYPSAPVGAQSSFHGLQQQQPVGQPFLAPQFTPGGAPNMHLQQVHYPQPQPQAQPQHQRRPSSSRIEPPFLRPSSHQSYHPGQHGAAPAFPNLPTGYTGQPWSQMHGPRPPR